MRKFVAALVVAALALTLVGCGGGGDSAETPTDEAAIPAPVQAEETPMVSDLSDSDSDTLPTPFPESFTSTQTPAVFADKLKAGRAMLIFFYDPAQDVTTDTRVEVDAVMNDYRGLIDLVTFDVGGAADDPDTMAAVTYATELGVASTPYILVVDKGGFITWRSKGYAVRAVIEREVEQATR